MRVFFQACLFCASLTLGWSSLELAPPMGSQRAHAAPAPRRIFSPIDQRPEVDLPVTYNQEVKRWIKYFRSNAKPWFNKRLERSHRYLPMMRKFLDERDLPRDLAYLSLIESGFSATAVSSAKAVGYWQFIEPTGKQYGLAINWWLDERRDFVRSTRAAANYLADLYRQFGSWHLTAAAYNMGETRLRRLIRKHKTRNFWTLSQKPGFPKETKDYIPKMIAAILIAKRPKLYGFHQVKPLSPYRYEYFFAPGGTNLKKMAENLGLPWSQVRRLNPAIKLGYIPKALKGHWIRIPQGQSQKVASFVARFDLKP